MRNILLIAKREYMEQVRARTFLITTILLPAVFVGVFYLSFLSGKHSGSDKHIAIASSDPALAAEIRSQILADTDAKATVDLFTPEMPGMLMDSDRSKLVSEVDSKAIDGFLWVDVPASGPVQATYEAQTSGDFVTGDRLQSALNHALLRRRLLQDGIAASTADTLLKTVKVDTRQIKNGKEVTSNAVSSFYSAYIMALLLTMTTMIYGLNVGRSVIQEKTSRIFEVMLATVKAGDMLTGKLVGIGAVGLTQILIWISAGAIFAGSALGAQYLSGNLQIHISLLQIVLFAVYFLLGYTLNSALFAGLGATLETEQELQQYSPLAALPVWLSFSMILLISTNPNSFWVVAASLFPPCTPIVMFLRMGSQMPPMWQIGASIALMLLAIAAVLWFSTRLYRIGILMYGKRATLPEMMRWLRYS
jgi:ABC-2 type transport system permease protein